MNKYGTTLAALFLVAMPFVQADTLQTTSEQNVSVSGVYVDGDPMTFSVAQGYLFSLADFNPNLGTLNSVTIDIEVMIDVFVTG